MIEVIKQTNFLGKTKCYLYEYGKEVLPFGLNFAKNLPGNALLYSWKDKFGVVSLSDIETARKPKSLLKENALYGFCAEHEGFTVVYNQAPFSKIFCVAFNDGRIRKFEGTVKYVTDNVIVFNEPFPRGLRVIIVNKEVQEFTLPSILEGQWGNTFDLTSKEKFNNDTITTRDQLKALMNYYKQVLKIDLQNYSKLTRKYVLAEGDGYIDSKLTMDKDCDVTSYNVKHVLFDFASLDEAVQNAKNVLIYIKKRYLALIEAREQQILENKQREAEKEQEKRKQEAQMKLQQKAIDEACDNLGSDL